LSTARPASTSSTHPALGACASALKHFKNLAFSPKQHRNNYLVFRRLAFLDAES
jgi:hypothetical protein